MACSNFLFILTGSYLFTLSNASYQRPGVVTVYDIKTNKIAESFPSSFGFSNPHDVAVSADGKSCYVVELNPYKVWKFRLGTLRFFIFTVIVPGYCAKHFCSRSFLRDFVQRRFRSRVFRKPRPLGSCTCLDLYPAYSELNSCIIWW